MSSYGGSLNCDELHADKIYWKSFNPPITGAGGDQTLASVLSNGNDANADTIINLNTLECGTVESSVKVETPLCEATQAEITNLELKNNMDGLEGVGKATITNCDLSSDTNIFPSVLSEDLEAVLIAGDNANGQSIQGLNSLASTTATINSGLVGALTTDSIEPNTTNPAITAEIGKNNPFHAITSETITANGKLEARAAENGCHLPKTTFYSTEPTPVITGDMEGGRLRCKTIQVDNQYDSSNPAVAISESVLNEGIIASSGLIQAQKVMRTPLLDCVNNTDGTPAKYKIVQGGSFEGSVSGTPATGHCAFTNCDFRSGTNLFNSSVQEQYEWLSVWSDATTYFPPPDGWRPYTAPQIPPVRLVYFDFNNDRPETRGWRYFAPQSDSDCNIDSDDKMGLHEGEYIHTSSLPPGPTNPAWQYAFYGETAPTTIASHAAQVVEFTFTSAKYGYGRIYMCLAKQLPPYTSPPVVMQNTFRLVQAHEGAALSTNPRLNGPITMKWYAPDVSPTDGTVARIFPMCRCDDTEETAGRLTVRIGNQPPLSGCNPGSFPDFSDGDTNSQESQLILRGYPLPTNFKYFTNPLDPDPPGA